jgi:hypothetical protein
MLLGLHTGTIMHTNLMTDIRVPRRRATMPSSSTSPSWSVILMPAIEPKSCGRSWVHSSWP